MKKITLFLLFAGAAAVLNACSLFSGPNCGSGITRQRGNIDTGTMGRDATIATLCVDRTEYNKGDTVYITFTVKNTLDEPIVLDNSQQPVMDICVPSMSCLSQYQPDVAQLTHLVLEPGQSHTLRWDWPPPGVDLSKSIIGQTNAGSVDGKWISLYGTVVTVNVHFFYGPRRVVP